MLRRSVPFLLITIMLSLSSSCAPGAPSDDEAVSLVQEFYLYYYDGKQVNAEIMSRGEYLREYKCYPIEFQISSPGQESFKKNFYFFKNEYGKIDVREFKINPNI